jgi:hypothetical protein
VEAWTLDRPLALALAAAALACAQAQPCPNPLEVCDGVCVDTNSDVDHCGACGFTCTLGRVCVAGACVLSPDAPCNARSGGAFVTFSVCGESVKAWIGDPTFVSIAEGLVPSGPPPYPVFDVRDGPDCDGQWTWHVDSGTARFVEAAAGCAACPGDIEAVKVDWISGTWCPGSSTDPLTFLVVDRR